MRQFVGKMEASSLEPELQRGEKIEKKLIKFEIDRY